MSEKKRKGPERADLDVLGDQETRQFCQRSSPKAEKMACWGETGKNIYRTVHSKTPFAFKTVVCREDRVKREPKKIGTGKELKKP